MTTSPSRGTIVNFFDTPIGWCHRKRPRIDVRCTWPCCTRQAERMTRQGQADEFAALALHILKNPMLNGETIRLDGALRMTPR